MLVLSELIFKIKTQLPGYAGQNMISKKNLTSGKMQIIKDKQKFHKNKNLIPVNKGDFKNVNV